MKRASPILVLILTLSGCRAFHVAKDRLRSIPWSYSGQLLMSHDGDDNWVNDDDNPPEILRPLFSPLDRLLSPKIDDRGLPLSDAFAAQIIGPALQVFWLVSVSAPRPSWLNFTVFNQFRGALLAPTLIHGAALSCCWLLGALVARAYEEDAIDPTIKGYGTVLWRIFQAGCFASGCLILSTQLDLLFEFGRYVQPGENSEIDTRILSAWIEVLNDIIFEILAIVPLRLYLAYSISRNKE